MIARWRKSSSIIDKWIVLPLGTLLIVGILFLLSVYFEPNKTYNWKGIRPDIRDTVKSIEKYGSVTSGSVGINSQTPQQWHRRKWLMKNANTNELKNLLGHPNGAVKATAYEGLIRNKNSNQYELIYQALNDTTSFVYFQYGCVGHPMLMGEYIMENLISISDRLPPLPPEEAIEHNLKKEEIFKLNEMYHKKKGEKAKYLKKYYN